MTLAYVRSLYPDPKSWLLRKGGAILVCSSAMSPKSVSTRRNVTFVKSKRMKNVLMLLCHGAKGTSCHKSTLIVTVYVSH